MVINTNIAATISANNLDQSTNMLNESLARLSSGSKIVNASDDPAGLAESIELTAEIGQATAANTNVSNAVSFLQTQDGYLQQVGAALDQMATLATEAQDSTKTSAQLAGYQSEFNALAGYINSTATETFNGVSLFSNNALVVTTDGQGGTFSVAGVDLGTGAYTALTGAALDGSGAVTLGTPTALTDVTQAITKLSSDRASVGASEEMLNFTGNELGVLKNNLAAANSQISDVDVATESTNYAKYQILVQSGTAMLAQANQNPQSVLKLLQ
ncbi:MAG: flagellin [Verrucomicrobiota bacterium]|jgi:flagellin